MYAARTSGAHDGLPKASRNRDRSRWPLDLSNLHSQRSNERENDEHRHGEAAAAELEFFLGANSPSVRPSHDRPPFVDRRP